MELQEVVQTCGLLVTLGQERCIGLQPAFVLLEERLELLAREARYAICFVQRLKVLHLLVIHALVVGNRLLVELLLRCLIFLLQGRCQASHLLNVDVYGMQREHRNGVVWIRVAVGVRQRRVVDRQGLDHLLTRQSCPVGKLLQVLELTYTEPVLRTQTEYRHSHTCATETRHRPAERTVIHPQPSTFLRQTPGMTVLTPFHVNNMAGRQVVNQVFVLKGIYAVDLYIYFPYREICIAHHEFLIHVPLA